MLVVPLVWLVCSRLVVQLCLGWFFGCFGSAGLVQFCLVGCSLVFGLLFGSVGCLVVVHVVVSCFSEVHGRGVQCGGGLSGDTEQTVGPPLSAHPLETLWSNAPETHTSTLYLYCRGTESMGYFPSQ